MKVQSKRHIWIVPYDVQSHVNWMLWLPVESPSLITHLKCITRCPSHSGRLKVYLIAEWKSDFSWGSKSMGWCDLTFESPLTAQILLPSPQSFCRGKRIGSHVNV